MNDMASAITPKSDQTNADDLIAGPRTITITNVVIRGGQEQPVAISYEGDDGKPYKPCKSMSRCLVSVWGPDASEYVGRSLTLYRDPSVRWGGLEVGGIRISHMSHLATPMTMALTATKGSRKPFTVHPLKVAEAVDWGARIKATKTLAELGEVWKACADKKKWTDAKDVRKEELTRPAEGAPE